VRFAFLLFSARLLAAELGVSGTKFTLDGKPFPLNGVSFFNAIYNPEFNRSSEVRREWIRKFQRYGVNTLRIWSQWDNKRGFVDTCPTCTLYNSDGSPRMEHVEKLKAICADADREGAVVELVLFSQESWHDGIKLGAAADRGAAEVARAVLPYRNVAIQIWNEFDERTMDLVKVVRSVDPKRLVSNSPGVSGVLFGVRGENETLDYLSPHTSRQGAGRTWEIAPAEIGMLLTRYNKPVIDDEPARNGTAQFGGPKNGSEPHDHIVQIARVWAAGGYVIYHHDMFQMGNGHATVPPSGIPDPEFSPYHRVVFEFLKHRDRYLR